MKILFICKANHGRSQLAEAIFNKLSEGKHQAVSAGTKVTREDSNKEGQRISDTNIITVMKEIGIDVSENVRNQVTEEMVKEVDKIIVMSEPENTPEYLKTSDKAIFWEVSDPYNKSLEFVRDIRNQLQVLISAFIKTLV
jgi:protein-tyrosine-phosphatase